MNWVRHGSSRTFETKSSYCRVARQSLPCYTAVARLGFKRRATAVLKSNSINLIRHGNSTTFETGLRREGCVRRLTFEGEGENDECVLFLWVYHVLSRLIPVSLTPNKTKTMGRMTCHCFQWPIRRDLRSSSYTTAAKEIACEPQTYFR